MPALSFKELRFPNMILTGEKPFTIRADTERNRRLFQDKKLINFYYQQRKKPEKKPIDINGNQVHCFAEKIRCKGSFPIVLSERNIYISQWDDAGVELNCFSFLRNILEKNGLSTHMICTFDLFEVIAKLDGFDSWEEMKKFFNLEKQNFHGLLILWEPMKMEPILQKCSKCGKIDRIEKFIYYPPINMNGEIYREAWYFCRRGCGE